MGYSPPLISGTASALAQPLTQYSSGAPTTSVRRRALAPHRLRPPQPTVAGSARCRRRSGPGGHMQGAAHSSSAGTSPHLSHCPPCKKHGSGLSSMGVHQGGHVFPRWPAGGLRSPTRGGPLATASSEQMPGQTLSLSLVQQTGVEVQGLGGASQDTDRHRALSSTLLARDLDGRCPGSPGPWTSTPGADRADTPVGASALAPATAWGSGSHVSGVRSPCMWEPHSGWVQSHPGSM